MLFTCSGSTIGMMDIDMGGKLKLMLVTGARKLIYFLNPVALKNVFWPF